MTARRLAAHVLFATLAAAPLAAQDRDTPRWRIDPYTRNDPKVMAQLGYVSYGPFEFGQHGVHPITTDDVDKHLHYAQILWVETRHLKIGTTLEAWTVPLEPTVRKKIRSELEQLEARGLPRVNPKARRLDPWLRLHLFAQRLEDHYAEFSSWLGVTDDSFPSDDPAKAKFTGEYRGEGPYLGQKGKYLFFLFEQDTTYHDYLSNFTGRRPVGGQQWNFKEVDALLYACSSESAAEGGRLRDDTALHAHVVHSATHNFISGYLHYSFDLPVWIREGVAHWFERRITPRFNSFTRSEGAAPIDNRQWRWDLETRKLLQSGKYAPFSDVYKWRDFGEIDFEDHVMIWSRWDYLMSLGKEKFAAYMRAAKGQVDPTTGNIASDIVEGTREALQSAYGLTPLSLEERWKQWVEETYPTK